MKILRLITVFVLVLGMGQAQAQFVKFGVKAGANFPSINEQAGATYTYTTTTGWHAGAAVQFNVPIVNVGAEFLYSANSGTNSSNGASLTTGYFTLPIFAKLSLLKVIQIHTGPQFNVLLNADEGGSSIKDQWDNKTFTWFAGAGLVLGPVDIHARFLFPQQTTLGTVTNEYKNSNIQLSLIYFINNK